MATKTKFPVFPLPDEHHHFTDYGFDPQIHFFQFLEEARKYKQPPQDTTTNLQFKLQKPIEQAPKTKIKKQRWWKNALLFFNLKRTHRHHHHHRSGEEKLEVRKKSREVRSGSSSSSMSGPVYITESRSGSSTPYRRTYSGPIAGTLTLPYVSLKELELEEQSQRVSISALPIYLVT